MKKGKVFLVITNRGEHSGTIIPTTFEEIARDRYQSFTGAHGDVFAEVRTRQEAEALLEEYLKCPAADAGHYCYTHNPGASTKGIPGEESRRDLGD